MGLLSSIKSIAKKAGATAAVGLTGGAAALIPGIRKEAVAGYKIGAAAGIAVTGFGKSPLGAAAKGAIPTPGQTPPSNDPAPGPVTTIPSAATGRDVLTRFFDWLGSLLGGRPA